MARPRKPSKILELNGAFKKDPNRRRKDAEGAGPFNETPPASMREEMHATWFALIAQVPPGVLTGSDQASIGIMATLLHRWQTTSDAELLPELRQWFTQYGLTASSRAKIGAVTPPATENPFGKFRLKMLKAMSDQAKNGKPN